MDVLRSNRPAVAAFGLALLLFGAWSAAAAYASPSVERTVERELVWTESAAYAYSVPVTRNSSHIPIGTLLPMGQPAYFRTVSDAILIDYAWSALAAEGGELRGVAAARMTIHVDAVTRDGRPYWSIEHLLAEDSTHDAAEGLGLSARLDLDALLAEYATVHQELPAGDGIVNWTVRTRVLYALEAGGRAIDGTVEHDLPFEVQDPRIMLPTADAIAWDAPHEEEQVHLASAPKGVAGVLSSFRVLGLLGMGIVLLLVSSLARRDAEHDGFEREHRRFKDWVSLTGSVPARADPVIEVRSLEDLVHVASDARTRVLLDPATRTYYALLPGVTYRYARHAPP